MMKTSEIIKVIEEFAPLSLSHEFVKKINGYDNSGLLIGGEEISHDKILVCMDVEQKDIDFAVQNGIKFIFAHHPYIYGKIGGVAYSSPHGREIISLIKNDITVYCAHLNLDSVQGGIDDTLVSLLGGEIVKTYLPLNGGGYGKISMVKPRETSAFESELKEKFGVNKSVISTYEVCKIASFCGSGMGDEEFAWAVAKGVDTVISADIKHHLLVASSRSKINIFDISHGYSEFVAMKECLKNINFAGLEVFFQSGKVGVI